MRKMSYYAILKIGAASNGRRLVPLVSKRGELLAPRPYTGKGGMTVVTYVTLSDLLTFCLVIIGVISLVIQAGNKKK